MYERLHIHKSLEPLEIDSYGNTSNWLGDFFGDEMGEITAHSLAAMKKREKENGR